MTNRSLIVGLGQIGMGYDLHLDSNKFVYTHARALTLHPAFQVVAGVDNFEKHRKLFEEHYKLPTYASIKEALEEQNPIVVVIATPTENHYLAISEVLANSSPKVIICEKPLAYNLFEANQIVDICEKAGVGLFVNYMRRADPGCIEIKSRIESGIISGPIKAVVWYSKGLLHNGSHLFNLLEFWLGPFVQGSVIGPGRICGIHDFEPDIHVEFKKGSAIFLSAWDESFSQCTIELLSPSGRLMYEKGGEIINWQSKQASPNLDGYLELSSIPELIETGMLTYQSHVLNQLLLVMEDLPCSLCTGKDSLKTLESIFQIIN